jgi:hypothetical protein
MELMHDSFDRINHLQTVPCKDRGAGKDICAGDRDGGPVLGLWRTFMIDDRKTVARIYNTCIRRLEILLKKSSILS